MALVLVLLLSSAMSTHAAPAEPMVVPEGPAAAPVAPWISIARIAGTNNALLSWEHAIENTGYQVWRGTAPYFDPFLGQGNQIAYRSNPSCGQPCYFNYPDDGIDDYAADGTLPTVQVIGVATTNYFWVVRGSNSDGPSGNSNRVGEFDFALVKGG